jgi:hypothetical protein
MDPIQTFQEGLNPQKEEKVLALQKQKKETIFILRNKLGLFYSMYPV